MELIEVGFAKDVFDRVECALDKSTINVLRDGSQNDTVGVAEKVRESFLDNKIIATTIVFKGTRMGLLSGIKVFNELTEEEMIYPQHGVVLLRDCCIDLLHSDRVIPIKEYIEMLEKVNTEGITLDVTSKWFSPSGVIEAPTIAQLKMLNSTSVVE